MMSSPPSDPRASSPRPAVAPSSEPDATTWPRWGRAFGLAGGGFWALALLAGACADDPARPPSGDLTVDAGAITCELGSEGCVCLGGSGCQGTLLCIAGRCLETEEPSGTESTPRDRPRPNGIESNLPPDPEQIERPDAAAPDAASPAGGEPDASAEAGDAG